MVVFDLWVMTRHLCRVIRHTSILISRFTGITDIGFSPCEWLKLKRRSRSPLEAGSQCVDYSLDPA